MKTKEEKKVFIDICSKPTDSKRYVSFKSKYLKLCLKNIQFFLPRRISMISEKYSLKEIKLKELKALLLGQQVLKIKNCEKQRNKKKEGLTFYFSL